MPKKHTILVYQFEELSPKSKEKARDWYRNEGFDEWWLTTYEDAAAIGLAIESFDVERGTIEGKLTRHPGNVADAILKDHGHETSTYKLAYSYRTAKPRYSGRSDDPDEIFESDLKRAYLQILKDELEYLMSDEQVDESIVANEYEFFKDGRRAVVEQYK